jgi:hypothetical protein
LGYIRKRKRKKNANGIEEESPSRARFASVTRNKRGTIKFQAKGVGKNACFPWK